jgi:hypothetical protein
VRGAYLETATAELLREHRKARLTARLRAGADWQHHGLVFCRFDETPWPHSYVPRRFGSWPRRRASRLMTLHEGGRHAAVSLMHDAEVRDDTVCARPGRSYRGVHAVYNHPLDGVHRQAAEQVSAQGPPGWGRVMIMYGCHQLVERLLAGGLTCRLTGDDVGTARVADRLALQA